MFRNATLAVLGVLLMAVSSRAAIMTSKASSPTVGLPGFSTWTLTAEAGAGEKIIGFDFSGGGGTYGLLGPMNQVNPVGQPTVFQDNNAFFPFVPADVSADAQFRVLSTKGIAINPSESANSLKAAFNYNAANIGDAAQSWTFVQVPISGLNMVNFRGTLTVSGTAGNRLEEVAGFLGIPEPSTVALLSLGLVGAFGLIRRR